MGLRVFALYEFQNFQIESVAAYLGITHVYDLHQCPVLKTAQGQVEGSATPIEYQDQPAF